VEEDAEAVQGQLVELVVRLRSPWVGEMEELLGASALWAN
jgi:hypothetical protein